jgi:hypothetical protein
VGLLLASCYLAASLEAQISDLAPPPGTKQFSFFPQGGNLFGDLFPGNFVDVDPGAGILAYNGSDYTYNGHNGCDTGILGIAAQEIGVPIFAALDGVVADVRDGEFDKNTSGSPAPSNFVSLNHGNGQYTQYIHMKRGSVAVAVGQQVKAGQQIGLTASSGQSTGPHLHFTALKDWKAYEPFAGSARPGPSGWVTQPPFRNDLYLQEIILTNQNIATWQGYPHEIARTGSFAVGQSFQQVGVQFQVGRGEGVRSVEVRYIRPDGSTAATTGRSAVNGGRNGRYGYAWNLILNVPGAWKVQIFLNDQLFTEAPFQVVASLPAANRPPSGVQVAFDPMAPKASDVVFCRITSQATHLDPDYDFVRYRYVWRLNGNVVRDVISAGLADAIPHSIGAAGDTLTCTVTPADGSQAGPSTVITANLSGARLGNISTRAKVGRLDQSRAMIGGFIIRGDGEKRVVLRAVGPSLAQFGVPNVLANPKLQVFRGQTPIAENDDWGSGANVQELIAKAFEPRTGAESALILSLPAGAYTAIVSGVANGVGNSLVEVYDIDPTAPANIANISTRADVGTGDEVMIGGLIVSGTGTQKVVIRAMGPSLTQHGVAGALGNPAFRIVNTTTNQEVAVNEDWANGPSAAELVALNFQPGNASEAAVVVNLAPGNYTAIVRGEANTTGVALVEAYKVD